MALPPDTIRSLEEFLQSIIDEQMDDGSAYLLFGGQEIVLTSPNCMDKKEWIEFGVEQIEAISIQYNLNYHVFSASPTKVILMED